MVPLSDPASLGLYMQRPVDSGMANLALQNASAMVRSFCRWQIAPVYTETLILDSDGGQVLQLPCLAVVSVASVTVDGLPVTDFTWSTDGMLQRALGPQAASPPFNPPNNPLPDPNYQDPTPSYPYSGYVPAVFPPGFGRVSVTYTGGYPTVPDDLQAVCLAAAARQYSNPGGYMQATAGGVRVEYASARSGPKAGTVGGILLSDDEQQLCGRYRIGRQP